MKQKTSEAAHNRWPQILLALGVDEKYLNPKKHSGCPVCGQGKDCYRFRDKYGSGDWICSRCGGGDGFKLIMGVFGWDFAHAAKQVDSVVGNCEQEERKPQKDPSERLNKIWLETQSIDSINPVTLYLKNRNLPRSKNLRIHPKMAYYDSDGVYKGGYPAMVAMFCTDKGEPSTLHITYLTKDGQKADVESCKKILPPSKPMQGGAIRLFDEAETMGVAEGIETALACAREFKIPVWPTSNAVMLEMFKPPEICKRLYIFGDNDASYTGQKSAYVLANKIYKDVQPVVMIPEVTGNDWADVLTSNAG